MPIFLPSLLGMRAPDLQNGGDLQFGMLQDKGFLYDSTMPTKVFGYTNMKNAMWPYSMDYKSTMVRRNAWKVKLWFAISFVPSGKGGHVFYNTTQRKGLKHIFFEICQE